VDLTRQVLKKLLEIPNPEITEIEEDASFNLKDIKFLKLIGEQPNKEETKRIQNLFHSVKIEIKDKSPASEKDKSPAQKVDENKVNAIFPAGSD
jgi:hypothetical protein